MAGNLFSDAGLVARGFDDATTERNRIAEQERALRFNTAADPMRLEASRMGLEEASMTLEEVRRKRAQEASMRTAVSGADPASGRLGATQAGAEAAKAGGDLPLYNQLSAAIPTLQREGWSELARAAYMGLPPEQAIANFNRMGAGRISAAEWGKDPKTGEIMMNLTDAQTGQKQVMSATKLYELFNPQKSDVHSIPAGGMGIVTTPGKAPQTFSAPQKDEFAISDGILYNKSKGTWMQVNQNGQWHLGTITNGSTEVPVRINRTSGEVEELGPGGQRSGMAARVTFSPTGGDPFITTSDGKVFQFKSATEAAPPSGGFFGFGGSSGTPGAPARMEPVETPSEPPVAGAKRGTYPDGRPGWFIQKDGKTFAVSPAASNQLPPNVPASDTEAFNAVRTGAASSATVNRQMPADEQAGLRPMDAAPAAAVAPKQKAAPKEAPKTIKVGDRVYDLAAEGKDAELKRLGSLSRLGGKNPNMDVQTWIAYADRLKALKKQGFNRGGPVTRYQGAGLG